MTYRNNEIQFLDCSGQLCPAPILMTEERMAELKINEVLEVLFTDPGAEADLEAWCRMMKYDFFELRKEKKNLFVKIRKKAA